MRTVVLTSTAFTGGVIFKFKESGVLLSLDTSEAELTEEQSVWLISKCPTHVDHLKQVLGTSKTAKLTELETGTISFEMFWNKYDSKTSSSRKRTLAKWDKMTVGEQVKAFNYINQYIPNIKPGVEKKYAETYLNAELWNN